MVSKASFPFLGKKIELGHFVTIWTLQKWEMPFSNAQNIWYELNITLKPFSTMLHMANFKIKPFEGFASNSLKSVSISSLYIVK